MLDSKLGKRVSTIVPAILHVTNKVAIICQGCRGFQKKVNSNRLIDQVIFYGKEYQTGRVFGAKALHQAVFDSLYRARAYLEFLCNFMSGKLHANIFDHIA